MEPDLGHSQSESATWEVAETNDSTVLVTPFDGPTVVFLGDLDADVGPTLFVGVRPTAATGRDLVSIPHVLPTLAFELVKATTTTFASMVAVPATLTLVVVTSPVIRQIPAHFILAPLLLHLRWLET